MSSRNSAPHSAFAAAGGPVANFFRPVGELCENAARSTFWLYVWVLRRSKPYLWLSRGRFGRAQSARKPSVEKLCDRPLSSPTALIQEHLVWIPLPLRAEHQRRKVRLSLYQFGFRRIEGVTVHSHTRSATS